MSLEAIEQVMEEFMGEFTKATAERSTVDVPALRKQWDELVRASFYGNLNEWDEQTEFEKEHFGELIDLAEFYARMLLKVGQFLLLVSEELEADAYEDLDLGDLQ